MGGPAGPGQTVKAQEQEVLVLVEGGEVAGVLTASSKNPADYTGATVYRVFTDRFERMRFGGPVPLEGVRGGV